MSEPRVEVWAHGATYEPYVGRWSRLVAWEFLDWLKVLPNKRWLDVGSGTGALVQTILDHAAPGAVVGVDRSEGFVEYARGKVVDPRATFRVADAENLQAERGEFDAVVSGLVLNFVPHPERMVAEMMRACRLNGRVALYVWDYAGKMEMLRHFGTLRGALDPAAKELDEGVRFPIANSRHLWDLFLDAGLNDVTTRAVDARMQFRDFDDFWSPFLGGQGPAPGYVMSLSEERRTVLRETIRTKLPVNRDGSIELVARAWAVKGTR